MKKFQLLVKWLQICPKQTLTRIFGQSMIARRVNRVSLRNINSSAYYIKACLSIFFSLFSYFRFVYFTHDETQTMTLTSSST